MTDDYIEECLKEIANKPGYAKHIRQAQVIINVYNKGVKDAREVSKKSYKTRLLSQPALNIWIDAVIDKTCEDLIK